MKSSTINKISLLSIFFGFLMISFLIYKMFTAGLTELRVIELIVVSFSLGCLVTMVCTDGY